MGTSALGAIGLSERRSWRFEQPGQQFRLAATMLGITVAFAGLLVVNSYAAYGGLLGSALATAPPPLTVDIQTQTGHYIVVTLTLALGYALLVIAMCVGFVHRLTGPTVALVRHARALKLGNCSSRVVLRERDGIHAELARHLNDLAVVLERERAGAESAAPRGDAN